MFYHVLVYMGHGKMFLVFEFVCGTPPSCLKVRGWVVVVGGLQQFSVRPKPLGFGVLGLSVWGQGLTIYHMNTRQEISFVATKTNLSSL